ncbi:MAG: caspase family protein, partial [Thermoguttaceae bacterium]|nr:caspase family protein [Thermoguttaceae bacterium]
MRTTETGENASSEKPSKETIVAKDFFALLVGVGDYRHSCDELPDLVYTCYDVLKVKRALMEKVGVPEENIRTLTTLENDPAKRPTRENIENGLGWLEDKSQTGSAVLAMLAGHGFETKNGEAAFAPEEAELLPNGFLKAETATSASALAKRLQEDDAKFKILIVDACRTPAGVDGK